MLIFVGMTKMYYVVQHFDGNRCRNDGFCCIYEDPKDAIAYIVDQHTEWEPENCFDPEYRNRYCKGHCSMKELGSLEKIKEYLLETLIKNGDVTYPLHGSCIQESLSLFKVSESKVIPTSSKASEPSV